MFTQLVSLLVEFKRCNVCHAVCVWFCLSGPTHKKNLLIVWNREVLFQTMPMAKKTTKTTTTKLATTKINMTKTIMAKTATTTKMKQIIFRLLRFFFAFVLLYKHSNKLSGMLCAGFFQLMIKNQTRYPGWQQGSAIELHHHWAKSNIFNPPLKSQLLLTNHSILRALHISDILCNSTILCFLSFCSSSHCLGCAVALRNIMTQVMTL